MKEITFALEEPIAIDITTTGCKSKNTPKNKPTFKAMNPIEQK